MALFVEGVSLGHIQQKQDDLWDSACRPRFAHALELRGHADQSVAAGREFIEAYVHYVHFVEGVVSVVHGDHAH